MFCLINNKINIMGFYYHVRKSFECSLYQRCNVHVIKVTFISIDIYIAAGFYSSGVLNTDVKP